MFIFLWANAISLLVTASGLWQDLSLLFSKNLKEGSVILDTYVVNFLLFLIYRSFLNDKYYFYVGLRIFKIFCQDPSSTTIFVISL